jgi:hypothetical protein
MKGAKAAQGLGAIVAVALFQCADVGVQPLLKRALFEQVLAQPFRIRAELPAALPPGCWQS